MPRLGLVGERALTSFHDLEYNCNNYGVRDGRMSRELGQAGHARDKTMQYKKVMGTGAVQYLYP